MKFQSEESLIHLLSPAMGEQQRDLPSKFVKKTAFDDNGINGKLKPISKLQSICKLLCQTKKYSKHSRKSTLALRLIVFYEKH